MATLARKINKMDPELRTILNTVAIDPIGNSHTHINLYGLYGSHAR